MTADDQCGPLRLGALEQQVMEALWEHAPLTVRDIIAQLGDRHAYTTIATVLGNLERKGTVLAEREGRSVHYAPCCTREMHAARLMKEALSTSSDPAASILHFIDAIDPREVRMLKEYLAGREDLP